MTTNNNTNRNCRSEPVGKATPNFRQLDVSRAIKAARVGGLDIESVVIDAAMNRITLNVKDGNAIAIDRKRQDNDHREIPDTIPERSDIT